MTRCLPSPRKTPHRHQVHHRFLFFLPAIARIPLVIRRSHLLDTTAYLGRRCPRTKTFTAATSAPRLGIRFTPHHSPRWARRGRHPQTFRMRVLPRLSSNEIHGLLKRSRPTARALRSRRLCSLRIHGRVDAKSFAPGQSRHLRIPFASHHNHTPCHAIPQFSSFSDVRAKMHKDLTDICVQ